MSERGTPAKIIFELSTCWHTQQASIIATLNGVKRSLSVRDTCGSFSSDPSETQEKRPDLGIRGDDEIVTFSDLGHDLTRQFLCHGYGRP